MNKTLRLLLTLPLLAALAGCCANGSCDCQDELADALFFRINYTRKRQYDPNNPKQAITFNAKDIDTLRIYRTSRRPTNPRDTAGFVSTTDAVLITRALDTTTSAGDTIIQASATIVNGRRTVGQDVIIINNAAPFAASGGAKLSGYNYRIAVVRNKKEIANYAVTNPQLQGRYNADGCCTCYENTGKKYTLTIGNQVTQEDAADSAGLPKVIRLRYTR